MKGVASQRRAIAWSASAHVRVSTIDADAPAERRRGGRLRAYGRAMPCGAWAKCCFQYKS